MPVSQQVLGMNARNYLYITRYNPLWAKRIADDKLETKRVLLNNDIPTPALLGSIERRDEIKTYSWDLPDNGFVIKPARGYGGEGIIAIKKWDGEVATTVGGDEIAKVALESHLVDVLEGAFSLQHLPDKAFIEERIILHPFFRKLVHVGIPDIRVIVLNHVPIMAMVRIPTEESDGKANLHQGAVAIGIDMRTGITTTAISRDKPVGRIPGTKVKTRGIKIPKWDELLLLAVKTQGACGLGYAGIDIVFDSKEGPMVLEVNARPGLSIQNANRASLRTRLERIEHQPVPSPKRGVEMAKSLFAEAFSEKIDLSPKVLGVVEEVTLIGKEGKRSIQAKVDSGALRTSIDQKLAEELQLEGGGGRVMVKSASGHGYRPTVKLSYELGGKRVHSTATVADRSNMTYPMIVGRLDLDGFMIDPTRNSVEREDIEPTDDSQEPN